MTEKEVYAEVTKAVKCQWCRLQLGVERHHIRYGACGRKTYRGNVILLCKNCHDKAHSSKKKYQPILINIIDEYLKKEDENNG